MKFCVLGSGSKGNAIYVSTGKTSVLIDAGFSGVEIERRLSSFGVTAESLDAIVVTHEHSDHIRGAGVMSRKYNLPVYATPLTVESGQRTLGKLFKFNGFQAGDDFTINDLQLHPFSVSHDAADPIGLIVKNNHLALGLCTDTGTVSRLMQYRLSGCQALILECNHDPIMLKEGPYPQDLKQRVKSTSGHLANEEALSFLEDLLHDKLEHVILAHISETNNCRDIIGKALKERFSSSLPGNIKMPEIFLAEQDSVSTLIELR